jgi:hypothetical protein
MKLTIEFTPPRMPARRRSRLAVTAALALAIMLPASVLANHIFSDVPTTMTGHSAIEALYDARVTSGCTATTYCPLAAVTRAQMAIFLQRGLGRVAFSSDPAADAVTVLQSDQNEVTIRTGGSTGGTQFIKADVAYSAEVLDVTGCPCTVDVNIVSSNGANSEAILETVDSLGWFNGTATIAFAAPSGSDITITVVAAQDVETSDIIMYADVSAITAAYGHLGTDVPTPALGGSTRGR